MIPKKTINRLGELIQAIDPYATIKKELNQ